MLGNFGLMAHRSSQGEKSHILLFKWEIIEELFCLIKAQDHKLIFWGKLITDSDIETLILRSAFEELVNTRDNLHCMFSVSRQSSGDMVLIKCRILAVAVTGACAWISFGSSEVLIGIPV